MSIIQIIRFVYSMPLKYLIGLYLLDLLHSQKQQGLECLPDHKYQRLREQPTKCKGQFSIIQFNKKSLNF